MLFRQPFTGDYPITLDYGEAWPPLYTHESPHRGIDYGTPMNTPILASADGTVTLVKDLPNGYGKYIMLTHEDGQQTLYAHLSSLGVRLGQEVRKGQEIGRSGSSGNSALPPQAGSVPRSVLPADQAGEYSHRDNNQTRRRLSALLNVPFRVFRRFPRPGRPHHGNQKR